MSYHYLFVLVLFNYIFGWQSGCLNSDELYIIKFIKRKDTLRCHCEIDANDKVYILIVGQSGRLSTNMRRKKAQIIFIINSYSESMTMRCSLQQVFPNV